MAAVYRTAGLSSAIGAVLKKFHIAFGASVEIIPVPACVGGAIAEILASFSPPQPQTRLALPLVPPHGREEEAAPSENRLTPRDESAKHCKRHVIHMQTKAPVISSVLPLLSPFSPRRPTSNLVEGGGVVGVVEAVDVVVERGGGGGGGKWMWTWRLAEEVVEVVGRSGRNGGSGGSGRRRLGIGSGGARWQRWPIGGGCCRRLKTYRTCSRPLDFAR
mmetsp:Transcript_43212/g.116917  ORF Transcript_43212/g.116917 Transcript_43212/m.116917 type:complete len:218 (+) Transcript_43212:807-1460(+)